MDLGAYSQIVDLKSYLKNNNIEIARLRGLRLMKNEETVDTKTISEIIKQAKLDYLVNWLQQHDDNCWSSVKADKKHKAFIYGINEDGENEVVDYDFSKVHGKDRKHIRYKWKKIEKAYNTQWDLFNKYAGQNVLYVHARIGGGNRDYYSEDWQKIRNHPLYLGDCDDAFDGTYCDIYFKIKKEQL